MAGKANPLIRSTDVIEYDDTHPRLYFNVSVETLDANEQHWVRPVLSAHLRPVMVTFWISFGKFWLAGQTHFPGLASPPVSSHLAISTEQAAL